MKYITFVVPCYNGDKYLPKVIESLAPGGNDVEIIIVNDGSKDNTQEVAESYAAKYNNVQVVNKENGGHGSGINKGIELATGLYLKVIDCDDWADEEAYPKVLSIIKDNASKDLYPDEYITNFYFNHFDEGYKYEEDLKKIYPANVMFSWNKAKIKLTKTIMLHSFFFKTSMLKDNNTRLLEKCFYEDCELVYKALICTNTMYYIPLPFYHYYIGRVGQSVSNESINKHHGDYLRVINEIYSFKTYDQIKALGKAHAKWAFNIIFADSILVHYVTFTHANKDKKHRYHSEIKKIRKANRKLANKINFRTPFFFTFFFWPPLRDPILRFFNKITIGKTGWTK